MYAYKWIQKRGHNYIQIKQIIDLVTTIFLGSDYKEDIGNPHRYKVELKYK